jgi:NAD(P)-dependent dehydrogenase (short-subunit alcohol dehydrogenase family)
MTGLQGKCALVTGASRGIGRAIARSFAEAGASVALNYHTGAGQAEALADEIRGRGVDAFPVAADVADEAAVDDMVGRVLERFGRIDLLVNNAGIILDAPLLATTTAEFDRIVAVNLRGTFLLGRACGCELHYRSGARPERRQRDDLNGGGAG